MFLIITMVTGLILTAVGFTILRHLKSWVVLEDTVAITVDRNGFIKRRLPSGRHMLRPFERVDFTLETKGKLAKGRVVAVTTSDGLAVNINWSGVYKLEPETITESISQRLRGLLTAEKAITRNTDIYLRKLAGSHTVRDLFNPTTRDRMERQLNQLLAARLKPLGIGFNGLNLQVIELPQEVAEAFNKAKAIETLDGVIRQLDPTTREVVRGAYQLDEILHWDAYLPTPSRLTMKKLEGSVN